MKMMAGLSLGLIFLISPSLRAEDTQSSEAMNIQKGNVATSGFFTMDESLSGGSKVSYLDASLRLQYYVINHLAIGGNFSYEHASDTDDVLLLGPAFHYFFWTKDKMGTYVAGAYSFGLTNATVSGRFTATVGFDHFLTPSVSIGPWIGYRHVFGRNLPDTDRLLLGASFSIYL